MDTSQQTLALSIHFMDGRYHGEPEWPPSPARLFQALVSGSDLSDSTDALLWLEGLTPPTIVAPPAIRGQEAKYYVPNNDLDGKDGKGIPSNIDKIRVEKLMRPRLFDAKIPVVYAWQFNEADKQFAEQIIEVANNLCQLGRGIDMAWATAEVLGSSSLELRLEAHPGEILRATRSGLGGELSCPKPGSLDSLKQRYKETLQRFSYKGKNRVFRQPAKAHFANVAYGSTPQRKLFDLRDRSQTAFAAVSQLHITQLTELLRDSAAARLTMALPHLESEIDRWLIGRKSEAPRAPSSERVRLILLPSIGHEHVDPQIRRLLVEIPSNCKLPTNDVFWAFSGLTFQKSGIESVLIASNESKMLKHYGIDKPSRIWQTVTPVALPQTAARRRIPPERRQEEAKDGRERSTEEASARTAVREALRHAGVDIQPKNIWVQREPFTRTGERAEKFSPGSRFAKEQLWHVEIGFREAIAGPLVIGNGRFLGLGIMCPKQAHSHGIEPSHDDGPTIARFAVSSNQSPSLTQTVQFSEVVRRALLHHSDSHLAFRGRQGEGSQPATGHKHAFVLPEANDGTGKITHISVISKNGFDESAVSALHKLHRVYAGDAFEVQLELVAMGACEDLVGSTAILATSTQWISRTPFVSTRHPKWQGRDEQGNRLPKLDEHGRQVGSPEHDVCRLLQSAGFPVPISITPVTSTPLRGSTEWRYFTRWRKYGGGRNSGNRGYGFEIEFTKEVEGPIAVGYGAHFGLGLFVPKGQYE